MIKLVLFVAAAVRGSCFVANSARNVIRDSQCGVLTRSERTTQPMDGAAAEQSAKLAANRAQLESLLSTLGQRAQ
jgi:hypothetical protein